VRLCRHTDQGPRNFPGEAISESPVTVGEERQQRSSSSYISVYRDKTKSAWKVQGGVENESLGHFLGFDPPLGRCS
jgi:hypothetical protein